MKGWIVFLLIFGTLSAEIQEVRMTWNKATCDGTCVSLLRKNLDRFNAVAAYKMEPEKGIAYLRWMPEANFDLISIKRIYQSVGFGFGVGDVMVKVRGVIERKGNDYILKSLGDGTKFRLLGPPHPGQTSFRSTGSWQSYPLSPDQKRQLQEGYANHEVVEVFGGLFYNQWDLPMIITQNIQFPDQLPAENKK